MQQLDLSSYQKVNGSFRRRLIYHAGIDCGFCVELNYIINNTIKTKSLSFVFWKLKFMLKSLVGHWLAFRAYGEYVIMKQRYAEPSVIAADCAKELLELVLTLPIDSRAAISADSMI